MQCQNIRSSEHTVDQTRMKVTVVFEVNLKETQNVIRKLKKSDRLMVNLPPTFPEIVIIK